MQILYVHGAGGSEKSFQWLREQLPFRAKFFSYDIDKSPIPWSARRLEKLIDIGKPTIVIGHSLGGLLATHCAMLPNVKMLVTLNAPYGGIHHAEILSWFTSESLIRDLALHSSFLTAVRAVKITVPHLAIVGTSGMPPSIFGGHDNDSVLTVASQTAMSNIQYTKLPLNHFEVLLSPVVANLINQFIESNHVSDLPIKEVDPVV